MRLLLSTPLKMSAPLARLMSKRRWFGSSKRRQTPLRLLRISKTAPALQSAKQRALPKMILGILFLLRLLLWRHLRVLLATALAHMAAYATLCGGLTGNVVESADAEMKALHADYPGGAKALTKGLSEALPGNPGVAAILPDIVGEAAILQSLAGHNDQGNGTVLRAAKRAGRPLTDER